MGKFKDGDIVVLTIEDSNITNIGLNTKFTLENVVYDSKDSFTFQYKDITWNGRDNWFKLIEEDTPSWKEIAESFGASFEEEAIVIKCMEHSFDILLSPTDPGKDAGKWSKIGWVEDSDGERIVPVEQIDQFCAALQAWKELYEQRN